jgi:hypothetical protein
MKKRYRWPDARNCVGRVAKGELESKDVEAKGGSDEEPGYDHGTPDFRPETGTT